jgi:AcrR family transcriptional regulator
MPRPTPRKRRDELILDALERLLARAPMSALDVEPIAAEAGITRTRFYAYYTSKNDALAALLRRLVGIRESAAELPDSWFARRSPAVRPRDAIRKTIERITDSWWPHRFVLREACDLWTAVPQVRDTWLKLVDVSATRLAKAILRERAVGVAPPGYNARRMAEALAWQNERLHFRAWAELPGAMSKKQLCEVAVEAYMRMIFLADDPDPEGGRRRR